MTLPALAAGPLDDPDLGTDRYARCLALAQRDAAAAFQAATSWQADGGGAASVHCQAIALVGQRRYSEAASRLDQLARDPATGSATGRSELFDQAGNAWILARQPTKADGSFTEALALTPGDPDILSDRARARGARKDWAGAEKDLNAVLAADPNRVDLLVLRASARHAQGRKAEARADIDHALTLYHDYPEALVERGEMKGETGDTAGALADWNRVLAVDPNGAAAKAARAHIAEVQAPPAAHATKP
ncbi:MAG: tetratricopeptide repeat protein [Rhizomicrobium sp.]